MFLSSLCLNFSVCNVGMVSGLLLHQASTCTQPGCCCTCWDLPMRVNFLFWLDPLTSVIRMIFFFLLLLLRLLLLLLLLLHPGHLSFCMQELSPPHPQSRTTQGVSHSAHRSRVRSSLSGTTQGVSSRDWLYPLRKESNPNFVFGSFSLSILCLRSLGSDSKALLPLDSETCLSDLGSLLWQKLLLTLSTPPEESLILNQKKWIFTKVEGKATRVEDSEQVWVKQIV